jgi:general secretion pathway protein M
MKRLDFLRDAFREMDSRTRTRWGIGIALILLLAIVYTTATGAISSLSRKRVAREADLMELMLLKQRYLNLKKESERLANRLAAVKIDDSPGRVIGFKGTPALLLPITWPGKVSRLPAFATSSASGLGTGSSSTPGKNSCRGETFTLSQRDLNMMLLS